MGATSIHLGIPGSTMLLDGLQALSTFGFGLDVSHDTLELAYFQRFRNQRINRQVRQAGKQLVLQGTPLSPGHRLSAPHQERLGDFRGAHGNREPVMRDADCRRYP